MTVGELIKLLKKYASNINIDIADNGVYSNIKGLSYTRWRDREQNEYETYSIVPEQYNKEDALIKDTCDKAKSVLETNDGEDMVSKEEMYSKIEYWFRNIGPFVFPEDNETLYSLLYYLKGIDY